MIWLAFPAFVFLTVRLGVVLINVISRQWLGPSVKPHSGLQIEKARDGDLPLVSVLIPARNEENNLPALLEGLLGQDYPHLEVRIFNDGSTDRTGEIIREFIGRDPRIHTEEGGESLPEGWNGKNHACHRLALAARGDYLLFMDADVRVKPDLVTRAVDRAFAHDLALLSLFPRQIMLSTGEMLTVPVMNWILLSMLPLRLVRLSHYPSLAAANGQFMLFRGREYRQHRFHSMVRDINVEDIHIIRRIKKMGYTAETLLSRGEVSCRMYTGYADAIFGFTRSMFAFFGGSGIALFLFTLFTTFGFIFAWVGMSFSWMLVYLFMALLLRGLVGAMSRQPVFRTLLLSPLVQASFVWMVVNSFRLKFRGKNIWKGRVIQFKGI